MRAQRQLIEGVNCAGGFKIQPADNPFDEGVLLRQFQHELGFGNCGCGLNEDGALNVPFFEEWLQIFGQEITVNVGKLRRQPAVISTCQ